MPEHLKTCKGEPVQEIIQGKAYVLGDNIDTDQIIPAHHLVYNLDNPQERQLYGKYAFSGVPEEKAGLPDGNNPFIKENENRSEYIVVIGGKNFGCGSSREHAPIALKMAGVMAVVALSYARIFYRNAVDGAYIFPLESMNNLSSQIKTGNEVQIDLIQNKLIDVSTSLNYDLKPMGDIGEIIKSGGIFGYAKNHGFVI